MRDELRGARAERGYFAARLRHAQATTRAIALHDAGQCQLATNDAVSVLPESGTRTLHVLGEPELATLRQRGGAEAWCLVMIRDRSMRWSMEGEYERTYQGFRRMAPAIGMVETLRDDVAELWLPTRGLLGASALSVRN